MKVIRRNFINKQNKLGNQKVTYKGKVFDSKREYRRFVELELMEKAGAISNLQAQVRFELIPAQYETVPTGEVYVRGPKKGQPKTKQVCVEQSVDYIADFVYIQGGKRIVEDAKAKIYCGANLASDSRTLKYETYTGEHTFAFSGGTVEANSLVGRKVLIDGVKYTVTANTASLITVEETLPEGLMPADTTIYPGEGGADGLAVFGCLFLGDNAYGVTELTGGGLEVILKQLGSGGTTDPLNQRSSVGWKAAKTAKILVEDYLVRAECTCQYSTKVFAAN